MVTTTTSSLKRKYRQPFHNKRSNGDKILDQLKYQQKLYSLELQRSRSFVLNPLVDLVFIYLCVLIFDFSTVIGKGQAKKLKAILIEKYRESIKT